MKKGTGFLAVLQSTLAAAFGVQTQKNRQRDFNQGRPTHFIIAGLLATAAFILLLTLIVKLVLQQTS